MICCLNQACHNPPNPDGIMFCSNCGVGLVVLRNRYRPVKSLGTGGFGKTYLAEDIDKLNEHCVIKQFAPQVEGTATLNKATELFQQEAKRLQQLGEHLQIPTLLAYFEQDNRLYLVQQFIDGQNLLAELQQQGIFNEQKVRELLLDLLEILKTVHQQKVIHRDIKPENIIRRGDGKLVLIDFGASKQLTATVMTQVGTTIGSFGYAPLEQMEGGKAYPASDLYSVGATCFHLLSGTHPWGLWKRQGYSWVSSWRQHLQQPVSQELGQMLDKLLQEEYQHRYQSTEEVLQDLNPPPPHSVPPTQPGIAAQVSPLVTVPSKLSKSASGASANQPVIPKAWPQRLLTGVAIILGGLVLTQFVGYVRYGLFPTNPISLIASKDSDVFLKRTLTGHSNSVNSVAISSDGKTLASGSSDETIKLWNLATGEQIRSLKWNSNSVSSLTISDFWKKSSETLGKFLLGNANAVLSVNGPVKIKIIIHSVAISTDGKTLASGSSDNTIKLWNLATGEQIRTLTGHSSDVNSVAISPDGKTLASGSSDKTIKLWNLATGEQIRTLTGHSSDVNFIAISPDGKTLVSGSYDNTIKLWNLATGEQIRTLTGHSNLLPLKINKKYYLTITRNYAISPDGKTLASGSSDDTITIIELWNLATGEQIRTLKGHFSDFNSVAISPDGKTLVSGSDDKTIKLWNLATGEQIRTLTGHSDSVNSVAISPDGKTLVSGSDDKTIKIWRLK